MLWDTRLCIGFAAGSKVVFNSILWIILKEKIHERRFIWCWNLFSNSKNKRPIPWCGFHRFLFGGLSILLSYIFWNRRSLIPSPLCWGEPQSSLHLATCFPRFIIFFLYSFFLILFIYGGLGFWGFGVGVLFWVFGVGVSSWYGFGACGVGTSGIFGLGLSI